MARQKFVNFTQDQNLERGHVFTKKRKTNPRSAVLKNITDKADKAANNWTRTKDPKYKDEWYKILKKYLLTKNIIILYS